MQNSPQSWILFVKEKKNFTNTRSYQLLAAFEMINPTTFWHVISKVESVEFDDKLNKSFTQNMVPQNECFTYENIAARHENKCHKMITKNHPDTKKTKS